MKSTRVSSVRLLQSALRCVVMVFVVAGSAACEQGTASSAAEGRDEVDAAAGPDSGRASRKDAAAAESTDVIAAEVDAPFTSDGAPSFDGPTAEEDAPPADAAPAAGDAGSATGIPTFVAVGYAGRRVRSIDLGLTWRDEQTLGGGGDDIYLLRGVGYARGTFVAIGWKILTSADGLKWVERKNPQNQWLGGIQFGNDRFVAVGGYGYSAFSADGVTWVPGGGRGTGAARTLAFGNGVFTAAIDSFDRWTSTDGRSWSPMGRGRSSRLVFCGGKVVDAADCAGPLGRNGGRVAFGAGAWVSVRGKTIERSLDGVTWKTVETSGQAVLEAVAFGYSAP